VHVAGGLSCSERNGLASKSHRMSALVTVCKGNILVTVCKGSTLVTNECSAAHLRLPFQMWDSDEFC